jgi:cobalt-zinc-cadmium efflux system membrane fusion protein
MTSNYRGLKAAVAVVLLIAAIGGGLAYRSASVSWWTRIVTPASAAAGPISAPELATGAKDALTLPADVSKRLAVQTEAVRPSSAPAPLDLSGTLMLDPDRLSHVHARFPGEIVELGPGDGRSPAVGFGQRVRKGQLLAVIWSQDLGEKKSELIDALSQMRVDDESLAKITVAAAEGAVPDRVLQESKRKVEADRIAISKAVRTLQAWRISKEEIDQVRAEAERLSRVKTRDREEMVSQWARLEVRAPLDGTVIERNVVIGELVDTSTDLFKIADLTRLGVLAHAYEEDLPTLDSLPASQRAWSVTVGVGGEATTRIGRFDQVGCIIDPNQHTALVMGWVDNPDGKLRVGQFVKTRLEIPAPSGEVVVPASALCEEGDRTYVFVQSDGKPTYARRQVAVIRRRGDKAYVRSQPAPAEKSRGLEPLAPGEQVVVSRVVQLAASLETLRQNADAH